MEKKKNLIFSIITFIVIVPISISYFYRHDDILEAIKNYPWTNILYIIILHNIFIFLMGYLNKLLIGKVGFKINLSETVQLQYVNNLINKIIPKGGGAFRAMYLKRLIDFPYSQFITTISGYYVIQILSQAIIGLLSMLAIYLLDAKYNFFLVISYFVLFLGSSSIIFIKFSIKSTANKILNYFYRMIEGWNKINENINDLLIFVLISVLGLVSRALQLMVIFNGLQVEVNFISLLYFSSLSIILMFINITPDGLGIREILYVNSEFALGYANVDMVLVSLILRIAELISSLIFGLPSYLLLLRTLNTTTYEK